MMPFQIISIWVRGLLSILLLVAGPIMLYEWYEHAHVTRQIIPPPPPRSPDLAPAPGDASSPAPVVTPTTPPPPAPQYRREFAPDWGFNGQTALFVVGLGALLWAIPKGPKMSLLRLRRRPGPDEPRQNRTGEVTRLSRPDGSELRVESYGPPDGPTVVLTHGWGLDSAEWYYSRKALAGCRLIVWDLPGLGLSTEPANHDYSLDNLARDLDAVIAVAGGRPVVLLGHSIGGMITLTHCKLFPEAAGSRVRGLVIVNSTYTNPLKTTTMAALKTALQKPLVEPLAHLMIWLAPLVRAMNWLSYWNGSAHRSTERSSFAGHETRGQLDFIAGYTPRTSPAVLARGVLGMLRYDATATLPTITLPTLIVTGDRDPVCKPDASQYMRSQIPGAQLIALSPAKHEGLIEHHDRFDAAVAEFVTRLSAPTTVAAASPSHAPAV